jgi:hypothetical protein
MFKPLEATQYLAQSLQLVVVFLLHKIPAEVRRHLVVQAAVAHHKPQNELVVLELPDKVMPAEIALTILLRVPAAVARVLLEETAVEITVPAAMVELALLLL